MPGNHSLRAVVVGLGLRFVDGIRIHEEDAAEVVSQTEDEGVGLVSWSWSRYRNLVPITGLVLLGLTAAPASNATISVTPGAVDDVINQNCSLVEAIIAANTDRPRDACPAGSGDDTLKAAGRFVLTAVPAEETSRTGLPAISSVITITNARISRAPGAPPFRIVRVDGGGLTLIDSSISGGHAVDCPDGGAAVCAGGILNTGVLTLVNTRVSENTATGSGPIIGGAGIVNAGQATLTDSIVNGNTARGDAAVGGGITNNTGATITLTNSMIRDNTASGTTGGVAVGGGLANFGTAEFTGSRVLGNSAVAPQGTAAGGGIYQENATTALTRSRVSGNTPDDCAPAIPSDCT